MLGNLIQISVLWNFLVFWGSNEPLRNIKTNTATALTYIYGHSSVFQFMTRRYGKCCFFYHFSFLLFGVKKKLEEDMSCILYLAECSGMWESLPWFCFYSPHTGSSLWRGLIHVVWKTLTALPPSRLSGCPPTNTLTPPHAHNMHFCWFVCVCTFSPPPASQRFIYSSDSNKQEDI